ncbi:MAG: hypothetical protein JWR16_2715 [Nevskia sp.]|nr:hypothetical protein [Nevskia sp.]
MSARTLFLLVLLTGAVHADTGKVYRWVDSVGHVHFSDQADLSAHEVKKNAPAASKAPVSDSSEVSDGGVRAQECQRKKEQLITYRHAAKVTETDGLGNTREYSPDEKQKLIELTEKSIHELCNPA